MKHTLTLKQRAAAFILLIGFCAATFFCYSLNHTDAKFTSLAENFWLGELKSNPIQFHYSVQNAEQYGVDESALCLPVYQPGSASSDVYEITQLLEQLKSIDTEKLNSQNQYLYRLLDSYLTSLAATAAWPYFAEPLSPSSGVPSELPILLAEYRLENREDIENYLSILSQIPDYFEGLMLYEQEKADAGLFMSDSTADKVIRQCMALMNPASLDDGSHFLIATFTERLQALVSQDILTQEEALSYQMNNDRILTTIVAPAYDKLADGLTLLKGSGKNTCGLALYDGGQDYYLSLIRLHTGSYRDIENIKNLLWQDLQFHYESLAALLQKEPSLAELITQDAKFLPAMTPEEILSCLQTKTSRHYPAVSSDKASPTVNCIVKYVDASLEPYAAPAFYMTPPVDNVYENTIYINALDTTDDISLFTTLAHEGYPGHLYQTVYTQSYWKNENISPLRSTLYYGGFVEGWAMYTELDSYDYAIELAQEADDKSCAAVYYQACRLNRQIQLCLYSLLDIAIHYDGVTQQDVQEIFASLGSLDAESVQAIYEYIAEEPCNYLKYYLGYLEILELKKQAAALWYDSDQTTATTHFDFEYQFHRFLLENGPADYQSLSALLTAK